MAAFKTSKRGARLTERRASSLLQGGDDLVTLSISRVEEEALEEGSILGNKLLKSAGVILGELLELNTTIEW